MAAEITKKRPLDIIGWREHVCLPELKLNVKAKIDTGARTSSLHAFDLKTFKQEGIDKVRFDIHPEQRDTTKIITCEAEIIDLRWVTDSGGHKEQRYVIRTPITLNNQTWPIEITLTERDTMLFRMLLGRRAIRRRFLVNPGKSFITTKNKVQL